MRGLIFCSMALMLLGLAAYGGQMPLTAHDISLMLRTGYSSDSLMRELLHPAHFADTLDAAKEASLTKAGASAKAAYKPSSPAGISAPLGLQGMGEC